MSKTFNKASNLVSEQTKSDTFNKLSSTCGTDMYPGMLAMDDKLVRSSERKEYVKGVQISDDDDDKLDDDSHNYKHESKVPQAYFNSQHSEKEHSDKSEKEKETERKKSKSSDEQSYRTTSDSASKHNDKHKETNNFSNSTEKPFDENDESTWSHDELMLKKLEMFRNLGELTRKGVQLSQNYTLESDYKTMKFEYDLHTGIRTKQNSISWMSNTMIGIIQGIELLNDNANPFDIKFENQWSNNVRHNIKDYYDVLGDIYEKYSTPGKKMSPELKLFLMLSGSAISIQLFSGHKSVSDELEKDTTQIKNLRKQAQNETHNHNNDSDIRSSDRSSRYKNNKVLEEKIRKEHENAAKLALDMKHIEESRKEAEKYKKMMENNNMNKLTQSMLLSDSAKSVKSNNSKKSKSTADIESIRNYEEYHKELKLNEQLMKAKNLLDNLEKIDKPNEKNKVQNNKQSKSQLETVKQPHKEIQPKKPTKKIPEPTPAVSSDSSSDSDDSSDSNSSNSSDSESESTEISRVSVNSTSSSISVRSDKSLKKLLGEMSNMQVVSNLSNQTPKNTFDTKHKTSDLISRKSNSSNSSNISSINIDSDEIRDSDRQLRNNKSNQIKRASDKELTFEAISLGKASNDSGSTSKRGRPRKTQAPLKIQFGR